MSTSVVVYFVVGILGIFMAFLIVHMARLSSQAKSVDELQRKKSTKIFSSSHADQPIDRIVFDEVSRYVKSEERSREISQRVSQVFDKELSKRTEEMSSKHEAIVKEKTHSEEVAWKKYKKVLNDKKTTEGVIRSLAEGLVVVDAEGKVIVMNPAAEKLLGVSKKEKIGRPITENLKASHLASFTHGGEENREIEIYSEEDETKKILRASSAVIENENGQTVGMVSVLSDITKQKELDQLKAEFVSKVSHELRTPLIAIQKSVSLLFSESAGKISETQKQFLSMAERNLKRLTLLINDLLDLSKLEAGKMQIKREYRQMSAVIRDTVETLIHWANTKSIKLEQEVEAKLPDVNIDDNRIIQVLTNLAGNAIKFTPNEGRVTISVRARHEKGEMEICVEDTGVGIEPDDLSKVFNKFHQVGERVSTDIAGTGLGLSVAKEIVELHGGRIWAESDKGAGARFIFTIPLTT